VSIWKGSLLIGTLTLCAWAVLTLVIGVFYALQQPTPLSISVYMTGLFIISICLLPVLFIWSMMAANNRKYYWQVMLYQAFAIPLCIFLSMTIAMKLRDPVWSAAFHRFIINTKPLVSAIETYQTDHNGTPPATLQALVPGYLAAIPPTGSIAFPQYNYWTGEGLWCLKVHCPTNMMDFSYYTYLTPKYETKFGTPGEIRERQSCWVYVRD